MEGEWGEAEVLVLERLREGEGVGDGDGRGDPADVFRSWEYLQRFPKWQPFGVPKSLHGPGLCCDIGEL